MIRIRAQKFGTIVYTAVQWFEHVGELASEVRNEPWFEEVL